MKPTRGFAPTELVPVASAGLSQRRLAGKGFVPRKWAHANPVVAKESGYIIDPHETDAANVPIMTFMGLMLFDDEGNASFVEEN